MLVGAFALAVHGYPRATMDMDVWVMPSPENAEAVIRALGRFGAPLHSISNADLQRDDTLFQIGVAPRRIDIITGATGLVFEETYARSESVDVDGLTIRVPSVDDLIINKTASGRLKDLADVEVLKQRRPKG
ncbi:MAG TPA: hypothetical protein PKC67_10585 [Kiritimatiellia bacterium]|nr:hypothetical protein [Kiritimatiellia bacterium]HMP34786.1 hypothetical protein [Kiritimatiellia bacterium]